MNIKITLRSNTILASVLFFSIIYQSSLFSKFRLSGDKPAQIVKKKTKKSEGAHVSQVQAPKPEAPQPEPVKQTPPVKLTPIDNDWKIKTTAEYSQWVASIKDAMNPGSEASELDTKYQNAFSKHEKDFESKISGLKYKEDPNFKEIEEKRITVGTIVKSLKKCQAVLYSKAQEKKLSFQQIQAINKSLVPEIYDKIYRKESNLEAGLDEESCQELVMHLIEKQFGNKEKSKDEDKKLDLKFEQDLQEKAQRVLELEAQVVSLNNKINTFQEGAERAKKLEERVASELEKTKTLMEELKRKDDQIEALNQDLAAKKTKIAEIEGEFESRIGRLKVEVEQNQDKIKSIESERLNYQSRLDQTQSELLESKKVSTESQASSKGLSQEMIKLSANLESVGKDKKELEEKLKTVQEQNISSQAKIANIEENLLKTNAQLRDSELKQQLLNKKMLVLQEENRSLLDDNRILKTELQSKTDSMLSSQIQLSRLKKQYQSAVNEIEDLEKNFYELSDEKNRLSNELKQVISEFKQARDDHNKTCVQKNALEKELGAKTIHLNQLLDKEDLDVQGPDVDELEDMVKSLDNKLEILIKELKDKELKYKQTAQSLDSFKQKELSASKDLESLTVKKNSAQNQAKSLKDEIDNILAKTAESSKEKDVIKDKLTDNFIKLQNNQSKIVDLQNEIKGSETIPCDKLSLQDCLKSQKEKVVRQFSK